MVAGPKRNICNRCDFVWHSTGKEAFPGSCPYCNQTFTNMKMECRECGKAYLKSEHLAYCQDCKAELVR